VSQLAYLLVALAMIVVLSSLLWLAQRKPRSTMSSIDEFRREMDALARSPSEAEPRRRTRGIGRQPRPPRPDPILPPPAQGDLARKLRAARQRGAGTPPER
jgi:hypothetical protein